MTIQRTATSSRQVFQRPFPNAVTYDLSQPNAVTITVPRRSTWTSGLHWHESHTEYLQVLEGCAFVTIGNVSRPCGPGDGVMQVDKRVVHEWQRVSEGYAVGELVVKEWTVPEDGQKEVFFRMLNSFLMEERPEEMYEMPRGVLGWARGWIERWIVKWVVMLQLYIIFWTWDNWPVLVGDGNGLVSWVVTHLTLWASSRLAYLFGLRAVYREYVDEELVSRAVQDGAKRIPIKNQ